MKQIKLTYCEKLQLAKLILDYGFIDNVIKRVEFMCVRAYENYDVNTNSTNLDKLYDFNKMGLLPYKKFIMEVGQRWAVEEELIDNLTKNGG